MRKVVNLTTMAPEPSYESAVITALPDVEYISKAVKTEEEIVELCCDAEVIFFTATKFTRSLLEKLPRLKLLVRYGIGYDNVDTQAAKELGIYVCNSPKYGVTDVAEHTVMLIFAAAKRAIEMSDRIREITGAAEGLERHSALREKQSAFWASAI